MAFWNRAFFCAWVAAVTGLVVSAYAADLRHCPQSPVELDAWEALGNDGSWMPVNALLNVEPYEAGRLKLRHTLPALACPGQSLFIRTVDESLTVSAAGQQIASYNPSPARFGYPWIMIPLPTTTEASVLELEVRTQGRHLGLTGLPLVGASERLLADLFAKELPGVILGALYLLKGLMALIGLAFLRRRTPLASVALFLSVLGVYTLANSRLRQLFAGTPPQWLTLEYSALFLLQPTAFFMFDQLFAPRGVWRWRPHFWISAVFAAIALPMAPFVTAHAFARMHGPFTIVFVVCAALFVGRLTREAFPERTGMLPRLYLLASALMLACGAFDLAAAWGVVSSPGLTKYGTLAFVAVVSWHVGKTTFEALRHEFELKVSLQHQLKMDHAGRLTALGEMAGSIAHEINNPLTIIVGKSQQVALNLSSGSPNPELAFADNERIHQAAIRLLRIANSMRLLGRDASLEKLEPYPARLLLKQVLDLAQDKIALAGIEFEVVAPDNDLTCHCRPIQISQVLLNLLNNAIDAVEKVKGPFIHIGCFPLGNGVAFEVRDNGTGIPRELEEKVFMPFYTTKPAGRGTGLGLSLSRRIAEAHGGDLSYKRDVGKRDIDETVFRIVVPGKRDSQGD